VGGRAWVCPVTGCAVGKRRAGRPPSFDGGVREGPDHVNESRHEVGNKRARGMFVLPALPAYPLTRLAIIRGRREAQRFLEGRADDAELPEQGRTRGPP